MDYTASRSYGTSTRWDSSTRTTISDASSVGGWINSKCLVLFRCCVAMNRVVTVEPVVFIYIFSAYLYVALLELYAFNRYGKEELEKNNYSRSANVCVTVRLLDRYGPVRHNETGDAVQGSVALLNLFVGVAGQFPAIFSALILGPFSDKYGRKPAMGIVVVGLVLQSVLTNIIFEFKLSLYIFILSSGLRSLTGGLAGILTSSYSYIADISPRKWLTLRLGILEAVTFIAASLSLGVAGSWIELSHCSFLPISWMLCASSVVLVLYLIFFLRESTNQQQTARRRRLLTTGPRSVLTGFKLFFCPGNPRWKLWFCLFTMCITIVNQMGTLTISTLFLLHRPLEWSPGLIGGYLAANEFVHGLSLITILPVMVACSLRDSLIVLLGVAIACATNIGMGFVDSTWQMFIAGSIQGVDAIITPALKAIMSKLVQPQDQGSLFSLISVMQVLCGAVAFVVYSMSYKQSLELDLPIGISFWIMAILYAISLPLIIALLMFTKVTEPSPTSSPSRPSPAQSNRSPHAQLPIPVNKGPSGPTCTVGSVEWALPRNDPRLFQRSPASAGQDVLERQSLLGHSRVSTTDYQSMFVN